MICAPFFRAFSGGRDLGFGGGGKGEHDLEAAPGIAQADAARVQPRNGANQGKTKTENAAPASPPNAQMRRRRLRREACARISSGVIVGYRAGAFMISVGRRRGRGRFH